ncbi:MAG: hypothetical protein KF830_18865 [Planctomycetes bacterium]|nr:hypothetical protein [Planctomycetota bacterium]
MRSLRSPGWQGGLALLAALVAAVVGMADQLDLVPTATSRLRDDAFYEFAWAANVAAGRGPMVSEGVTTSGVQLLWSLLLVPVAALGGAAALPVVAPWLGFGLHLGTAGLWWFGTRDRLAGCCLALCWLGHPLLLRESQNGQETALAGACLVGLWLVRRRGRALPVAVASLAVLARSELWAFVVAVSLARHGVRSPRAWLAPACSLLVHLVANRLLGGGWWPDSALPMAWLAHANHALLAEGAAAWFARAWWFARPVLLGSPWALASAMGSGVAVFALLRGCWPARLRLLPIALVGAAAVGGAQDLWPAAWAALGLLLFPASRWRRPAIGRGAWLLAAAALVALHWAVRWYPRDYYLAPLVVVAMLALRSFARWRWLLVVFALAQVADRGLVGSEPLAGQAAMELAGRFAADVVPAGTRLGSFNSGLVTFQAAVLAPPARRLPIVNLDGVVDARAFAALRQRRLSAWLDEQRIAGLLDHPVQFALDARLPHACGHWFGQGFAPADDLQELARFVVPGATLDRPGTDSVRLYWRRGMGPPPPRPAAVRDLGIGPDGGRCLLWPARAGEVLEAEGPAEGRRALLGVDADTVVVLRLPDDLRCGGRLFVRGQLEPLLRLGPL